MKTLPVTKLTYLEDMHCYETIATVVAVTDWQDGRPAIVLDATIFYPQGGGQPFDRGTITTDTTTFNVAEVRFVDGIIYHIGEFETGEFATDETANVTIDQDRRFVHARVHSAAHIMHAALTKLGYSFEPVKGYHYLEGSYMEYEGTIPNELHEGLKAKLEEESNRLAAEGAPVKAIIIDPADLPKWCHVVPKYVPENKPCRVVIMNEAKGFACGGTHVTNTKEIGRIVIRSIKHKDGNTRIGYTIDPLP